MGFEIEGGKIAAARVRNLRTGEEVLLRAAQYVNAGGAWAGKIARLAGCDAVHVLASKGTLIISNARIGRGGIARLRPPDDGEILMPGGTVSIPGTASITIDDPDDPDDAAPTVAEVDHILDASLPMLPTLPVMAATRWVRAFSGVRPLLMADGAEEDGCKASRGGQNLRAQDPGGLSNVCAIAGSKLTTFRQMAEKTANLDAARLGNTARCRTANKPCPRAPVPAGQRRAPRRATG